MGCGQFFFGGNSLRITAEVLVKNPKPTACPVLFGVGARDNFRHQSSDKFWFTGHISQSVFALTCLRQLHFRANHSAK
ncbi:hypothetical protein CYPRO_3224 [Cyclonatronum proteinivorum]|uniref:Uncharacterized protein n=1 Tax=Cyclonatronum proteinivorum TaxID=1457365 RepID=A0A345UPQ5_9BACT|nr:hypothetical protein CYPRO_3224 [Cyclonatronum proteinivorum]